MPKPHRSLVHRLFSIAVFIKGIDGALEIIGGLLFLLTSTEALNNIVIALTQHELIEDPHDLFANWLRRAVQHLSSNTKLFGTVYLVGHGVIKIFLAVELLRNKLWAYPVAVVFLILFILYQAYRLSQTHAAGLALLTAFDCIVVALIVREYRYRKGVGLSGD